MSTVKITQKIASVAVSKPGAVTNDAANEPKWQAPDENPLEKRINRRPDDVLPSETNKISLSTREGKQSVYVTVSYVPVEGTHNGETIVIERPLEIFIPAGQIEGDHQWISATMRSLSLAARGGFIAKALSDMRKVTWTQGPVRCGKTNSGKPRYHDSEVAAIAWCIQQMLHQRGFLNENGKPYPLEELVRHFDRLQKPHLHAERAEDEQTDAGEKKSPLAIVGECPDADCRGDMLLIDGCPTCICCGYSKCG